MKHLSQLIPLFLVALSPATALAQHHADPNAASLRTEEAAVLMQQRHFYAASLQLEGLDHDAQRLICDYHLATAGTLEKIKTWTALHPVAAETNRLQLLLANLYAQQGDHDDALAIYAEADLRAIPQEERDEAMLYQAVSLIGTGQLTEAQQRLDELQNTTSHQADVTYYQGYIHYAQGRYEQAMPYFRQVENTAAYRRIVPIYLADCLLQSGNAAEALNTIRTYNRSAAPAERVAEADRIEGEALYDSRSYHDAITALKRYTTATAAPKRTALYKLGMSELYTGDNANAATHISQSAGSQADALAQNAWLHAGIAYVKAARKQQAGIAFQQAAGMNFDTKVQEEALYNYALTLHEGATMGFGESVRVFEDFLNRFPQSKYASDVSNHLAEVYFTTRNYPAALASINKIKNPNAEIINAKQQVLYNLGVQRFSDGDFAAARDFMAQSIQTRPNAESYFWKGEAEYRLGRYTTAVSDLNNYIRTRRPDSPNRTMALYSLGYSHFQLKSYTTAQQSFRQVADADAASFPSTVQPSLIRADALNRLADCLFAQRSYDEAYATYERALQTNVTHGDYALLQQAFISGLRGDYTKKVQLLNQLEAQFSSSSYSADALFQRGRAYIQSGQRQQALDTYRSLLQKYPLSPQARQAGNEIGMIFYEDHQVGPAIAAYKQVLQQHPNTEEAATALANLKDIYTEQGQLDDYTALAAQHGQTVSAEELDKLTAEAALRAQAGGNALQALQLYQRLEAQTASAATRLEALEGQLTTARAAQRPDDLLTAAGKILRPDANASPELASRARLERAHIYMERGNTDAAVADWQIVRQDQQTVYGAQATVELAQYAFDTQQYPSAETILSDLIQRGTPHAYWLARAFVLLSDVYARTNRQIEARQYLLALQSNYTDSEEINRMITQRLAALQ